MGSTLALAYEFLKSILIENPESFLTCCGSVPRDKYKAAVLAKCPGHPVIASALWFQEQGAISEEDVESVKRFRDHRNRIAHELPNILFDTEFDGGLEIMLDLYELIQKVERWWIIEIEIPANPQYDGQAVEASDIDGGCSSVVNYLTRVAYNLD